MSLDDEHIPWPAAEALERGENPGRTESRTRAKARGRALALLRAAHPEDWRRFYDAELKVVGIDTAYRPKVDDVHLRFWGNVSRDPDTGCVMWLGFLDPAGYGRFKVGEKIVGAHRFAYEFLVGPIPDGLHLDHLCRTPACVNPLHLEPVTPAVNTLRGMGSPAQNARKTHCIHGHEFTPENTIHHPGGRRECRECRNAIQRQRRRRAPA